MPPGAGDNAAGAPAAPQAQRDPDVAAPAVVATAAPAGHGHVRLAEISRKNLCELFITKPEAMQLAQLDATLRGERPLLCRSMLGRSRDRPLHERSHRLLSNHLLPSPPPTCRRADTAEPATRQPL